MMYRQITSEERYTLGLLRQRGLAPAAIARLLGRHRSTISRECVRNGTPRDDCYRPQLADWYARGRKYTSCPSGESPAFWSVALELTNGPGLTASDHSELAKRSAAIGASRASAISSNPMTGDAGEYAGAWWNSAMVQIETIARPRSR